MSAHRPIAHRAFSLLVAFLLVGSLAAAPIAAATGTASASTASTTQDDGGMIDGSFNGTCDSTLRFAFPISCPVGYDPQPVDTGQDTSVIKTDMHVSGQSIYESQDSYSTVFNNYLNDTETLASLEARDAIARAYENNESVTTAQSDATMAIRDYYAAHQKNVLEQMNADTAQIFYYVNASNQHDEIEDRFIHSQVPHKLSGGEVGDGDTPTVAEWKELPETTEYEVSLLNGSTETVYGFDIDPEYTNSEYYFSDDAEPVHFNPVADWDPENEEFLIDQQPSSFNRDGGTHEMADYTIHFRGVMQAMSHADANLLTEEVYDYRVAMNMWTEIENQADSVQSNYPATLAEEMYQQMDDGEVSPTEVRGAEGMVRYLSGNETDGDSLELALRHTLDLDQPKSMDSQMVIDFEGETDRQRVVDEEGNVEFNYSSVNETYEGLLFASGFPDGTAETGVEYNVSTFDGTPSILTADGEKRLYSGTVTIQEMYDDDGNAVDTMTYSGPEYGTYNSSEFAQALIDAQEERQEIVDEGDDDDGGSDIQIDWDDLGGISEGAGMLGVGLVAIALLAVAGFVLDLIPGLGN